MQPAHLTDEDTDGQRGEGTQTCLPLHPESSGGCAMGGVLILSSCPLVPRLGSPGACS